MKLDEILEQALEFTLAEEGGWSNNKADRGGATNFGITLGVFQGLGREADLDGDGKVDAADLKKLTPAKAKSIYARLYWVWDKLPPAAMAQLAAVDPRIMIKQFDIGVNMGVGASVKLLQRAVNAVRGEFLAVDGAMGAKTVAGICGCQPDALLAALARLQGERYESIVARDNTQAVFLKGWRERADRLPAAA